MNDGAGIRTLQSAGEHHPDRPTALPCPGEPGSAFVTPLLTGSLIGIQEIRAIFGLGRTAAYELTHRSDFPAPVRISPRCYRWWVQEVAAFAADLREQPGHHGLTDDSHRASRRAVPMQGSPALRITGKVRVARGRKEAS